VSGPVATTWPRRRTAADASPAEPPPTRRSAGASPRLRRLSAPARAEVRAGPEGAPQAVGRAPVAAVLEDWVVEDRWWTGRPLRRRYFELVLADGRNVVVFRDLAGGGWYRQRA
jgi:hypothetical protein